MEWLVLRTSSKIVIAIALIPVFVLTLIQFSGSYEFYIVMSNSTAPAYQTGDIVLLDKHVPWSQYHVGDAVLYSPPNFNEIIIHKIYDIQVINGTYYFAIKGDANPQPDSIPQTGDIHNELLANRTVTWTTFYNSSTKNPTAPYVVASYYPASQVVYGKVIFKIPFLGWLFVPFNSPLPEPLNILPISMFSTFTVYYALLLIASIFLLMNKANKELKQLINSLTVFPKYIPVPTKISLRNFYSLVIFPLIFFLIIFFAATPTPMVNNDIITLQPSTPQENINNVTYTHLVYQESNTLNSAYVKQDNKTTINLLFTRVSNVIIVNVTKYAQNQGQNINSGDAYNVTTNKSYQLNIDAKSMFVINSTEPGVPELGRFFDYMVPVSPTSKSPIGLMTQNVYLEVSNATYNNESAYATHLDFNFIQDLVSYTWQVHGYFSKTTGYLLYLHVRVTQQLWGIPETVGMFVIVSGVIFIYAIIRRHFQKLFDEKQENIFRSQNNSQPAYGMDPILPNNLMNLETLDKLESKERESDLDSVQHSDENNSKPTEEKKKKLSWEEWKKLEEEE